MGVARRTIAKFETGGNVLPDRQEALRSCFVRAGVEFINGGKSVGVKVPRGSISNLAQAVVSIQNVPVG